MMEFRFKKGMDAAYKVSPSKNFDAVPTRKIIAKGALAGKIIAPAPQRQKPFGIQYQPPIFKEIRALIGAGKSSKPKSKVAVLGRDQIKFVYPQVDNFVCIQAPLKNSLAPNRNVKPQFNWHASGQGNLNPPVRQVNPPPQHGNVRRATPAEDFRIRTVRNGSTLSIPRATQIVKQQPNENAIQAETHPQEEIRAVTLIQAAYRGAKARGKRNKFGFNEIKNTNKEMVGYIRYKADRNVKPKAGKFASQNSSRITEAIWPNPPDIANGSKGGFKKVAGKHGEKFIEKYHDIGGAIKLKLHDPTNFKALKPEILEAIKDLKYVVQQHRVSTDFLVSKAMEDDLSNKIRNGSQAFNADAFKEMLKNLKALHEKGIVHRDIKPANLFVKEGEVYLGDLDMMGKMGKFTDFGGTRRYLPAMVAFNKKNQNSDVSNKYGKYLDNYAMVLSMMEAQGFNILNRIPIKHFGNNANGDDEIRMNTFRNDLMEWIYSSVKEELNRNYIWNLLLHPEQYMNNLRNDNKGAPHLYDMIQFSQRA